MFEFAEEALDEIACAVDGFVDRSLHLAITLGRNVGLSTAPLHQIDQMLPVIAAIGDDDRDGWQAFQQGGRCGLVGSLPCRESEANRQSLLVDDDVELAGQSATRTADGVIRTPFLPPAAC